MRNGFNGLVAKVQTTLKDGPMPGHVFIFRGRSGSQVKLLWSTGDGLCLLTKRLERGRFAWLSARDVYVRTPLALTEEALKRIGDLYAIEAEIRGVPTEQRLGERQQKAKPRLKSLESWLRKKMKTLSRHSELGKAFAYALNQWPALTYFFPLFRMLTPRIFLSYFFVITLVFYD
jgi:hypothetical protein